VSVPGFENQPNRTNVLQVLGRIEEENQLRMGTRPNRSVNARAFVPALLLALLAAAVLPSVAQAHHSPPVQFQALLATTAPNVNGQIDSGEWVDTPSYAVNFGGMVGTVRFKHVGGYLYGALNVADNGVGTKKATFLFDDNHNGVLDPGEDAIAVTGGSGDSDFYYSTAGSAGAGLYSDRSTSGTNPPGGGREDVVARTTDANGSVTFEFRHPLCSSDTVHDFCLTPGSTAGVDLQYQSGAVFGSYPGASPQNASDWGDLTISGVPAAIGRIVFESNRDGNLEVYKMNADGTGVARMTQNAAADTMPSISPDGLRVAFTSDRDGNREIYVMGINSANIMRLTTNTATDEQPAWSPDGTKIAYTSYVTGNAEIFVMNADGTGKANVTNNTAADTAATWSPDGTQIAFTSTRAGNAEIYRTNANGSGTPTRLTNSQKIDSDPDWSPDGSKIAFFSDRGPKGSVWTMSASTGSNVTNLTRASVLDSDPSWSPDGARIAFTRDAGGGSTNVWSANADGSGQINLTGIGGHNAFPDWGPFATGPESATVAIEGAASSLPGAISARIANIPLDAIRGQTGTSSAAPLGGIPLGGIPLGGIPLGGIPLGGIPLGGIGFTADNLNQNGLGGVPLSTIPLVLPDTWEAHLALDPAFKGTPPQNVTLAQVLGTPVVAGINLENLTLGSSPLGGIPLAGIALGGLPLGGIPLGGIAGSTEDQNLADWCAFINQQPGFSCPNGDSLIGQTMLGLSLEGVPLGGIPLGGIPLGGIPLGGIPLGGIPVGTPLGGIPLGGINLMGTPLGGIPLGGIDMSVSPLGGIQLGSIPLSAKNAILICPTGNFLCANTDTLAAAEAAGAIKPTALLQDLGYYKDASGQDITLANLIRGLPPSTTLEDLLGTVLLKAAYDWEALPLPGFPLQDFSTDGGVITYMVPFTVEGIGPRVGGQVSVRLPAGARYVLGSTVLSGGTGIATGEPTLNAPQNQLTWAITGIQLGTPYTLTFRAKPGLSLGVESASAEIVANGLNGTFQSPSAATTMITEPGEPANGDPSTAPSIQDSTLYLGYTSSGSDRDFFHIQASPGEQLTIHLSHLAVDDDLVVYGPDIAPLRTPHAGQTASFAGDVPFELGQRTQSITPEALRDVPQNAAGQPALDVSDNRGLADEEVSVVSPNGGTYTIQVSSFDGGYSNDPWLLRVDRAPAIQLPTACTNPPATGGGVTKTMPSVPANASTLYLFASKRFGDLYGLQAENDVWNGLQTLAARTDAAGGAVIPVDANGPVQNALAARAADPCSFAKANDVVRAVGTLLDDPLVVRPSVRYIVVVGDDAAGVPFGRVLDNTSFANERGYTSTFYNGSANNQYLSTYARGFLPTDDALGDVNYPGTGPYVPELAVGRLVETPSDILAQINQYVTRNGSISPAKALTTGYDFLTDGASQIAASFAARLGSANSQTLINESWSKFDALNALFPATNPPQIASVNAHYDHFRALPANENAAHREDILLTSADVAPGSTSGRVIFTMGCHSVLPVSDFVVGDPLKADWSQAYARGGAIVYMGNTGYGLGDTAAVLYSEKLNVLFANRLDGSMTVGQALAFAKQEYASTPTQSGYHSKVIDEATMMGLPMYSVGSGTPPAPPQPPVPTTDSATGLPSTPFSVNPSFTRVDTANGSYYVSDDSFAENRRPIEPTARLDITQPGLVAHGALITGLTSVDQNGFNAAFSRVVEDLSGFSPELAGDSIFPTKLQWIGTIATLTGTRQRLGLFTGQFRSDGTPDAEGIGTQRRYTSMSGTVFYALPNVADFSPPSFGPVTVSAVGGNVAFDVNVADDGGAANVKRVFTLYKDATGLWKSVEMSRNGSRWTGAAPFSGSTVEWFMQAVDGAGNTSVTSNKSAGKSVSVEPPTGTIQAQPSGPQTNGWFTDSVTVALSGAPGITYSLDGAPFTSGTSLVISGTGVHTLDFQGTDGSHGSLDVPIDTSPPTVEVNATYGIGEIAYVICADAGSGIAVCNPQTPLDTSTIGTKTVTVHAEDRAGHVFDATLTYTVVGFTFVGFAPPIANPPVLNDANGGSSIPVKFSLTGFHGLDVLAQGYPQSQPIDCTTGAPTGAATPTSRLSFAYDPLADQYIYTWNTDVAWNGTCRQLIVQLDDGTVKRANFRFH
jgi:Tol biopolymer transport system component